MGVGGRAADTAMQVQAADRPSRTSHALPAHPTHSHRRDSPGRRLSTAGCCSTSPDAAACMQVRSDRSWDGSRQATPLRPGPLRTASQAPRPPARPFPLVHDRAPAGPVPPFRVLVLPSIARRSTHARAEQAVDAADLFKKQHVHEHVILSASHPNNKNPRSVRRPAQLRQGFSLRRSMLEDRLRIVSWNVNGLRACLRRTSSKGVRSLLESLHAGGFGKGAEAITRIPHAVRALCTPRPVHACMACHPIALACSCSGPFHPRAADIVCLQETKLRPEEVVQELALADGWCAGGGSCAGARHTPFAMPIRAHVWLRWTAGRIRARLGACPERPASPAPGEPRPRINQPTKQTRAQGLLF